MRVHTRTVIDIASGRILEDEWYEYDGPLAHAGGGGGAQTTSTEPPSFLAPTLETITQAAEEQFRQGPTPLFSGQTVAGLDPTQIAGRELQTQFATLDAPQLFGAGAGTAQDLLQAQGAGTGATIQNLLAGGTGGVGVPTAQRGVNVDPALQQLLSGQVDTTGLNAVVDALTRGATQQFQRDIIPSISRQGVASGGFGGSRQEIAEGIAAGDLGQRVGDVQARIFSDALRQARDLQAQGVQGGLQQEQQRQQFALGQGQIGAELGRLALQRQQTGLEQALQQQQLGLQQLPQLAALGQVPGQVLENVGAANRGFEQQLIDAERARFEQEAGSQGQNLDDLIRRVTPLLGGGFQSTTAPGATTNALLSALGGAGTGAAIGAAIPAVASTGFGVPLAAILGAGAGFAGAQ